MKSIFTKLFTTFALSALVAIAQPNPEPKLQVWHMNAQATAQFCSMMLPLPSTNCAQTVFILIPPVEGAVSFEVIMSYRSANGREGAKRVIVERGFDWTPVRFGDADVQDITILSVTATPLGKIGAPISR